MTVAAWLRAVHLHMPPRAGPVIGRRLAAFAALTLAPLLVTGCMGSTPIPIDPPPQPRPTAAPDEKKDKPRVATKAGSAPPSTDSSTSPPPPPRPTDQTVNLDSADLDGLCFLPDLPEDEEKDVKPSEEDIRKKIEEAARKQKEGDIDAADKLYDEAVAMAEKRAGNVARTGPSDGLNSSDVNKVRRQAKANLGAAGLSMQIGGGDVSTKVTKDTRNIVTRRARDFLDRRPVGPVCGQHLKDLMGFGYLVNQMKLDHQLRADYVTRTRETLNDCPIEGELTLETRMEPPMLLFAYSPDFPFHSGDGHELVGEETITIKYWNGPAMPEGKLDGGAVSNYKLAGESMSMVELPFDVRLYFELEMEVLNAYMTIAGDTGQGPETVFEGGLDGGVAHGTLIAPEVGPIFSVATPSDDPNSTYSLKMPFCDGAKLIEIYRGEGVTGIGTFTLHLRHGSPPVAVGVRAGS